MPDFMGQAAFDPFVGSQALRRKAYCTVVVNGVDVTNKLDPHLLSVSTMLRGSGSDAIRLELDNRDARLQLPPMDSMVIVALGWSNENLIRVTRGIVNSYESSFSRHDGGRKLYIDTSGANERGQGRSIVTRTWGTGAPPGKTQGKMIPFSQIMQDAAKAAGYAMDVSAAFAGVERDWWQQVNESFHHFGLRMAQELGGVFKLDGDRATFTKPGESVDGKALPTIRAKWGDNLLSWRIKPFVPRGTWGEFAATYYDAAAGEWKRISEKAGLAGAPFDFTQSIYTLPVPAPNKQVGQQQLEGVKSQMEAGVGWMIINGEPLAVPHGKIVVEGAGPGVDTTYTITNVDHVYSRGGYLTRVDMTADVSVKGVGWQ